MTRNQLPRHSRFDVRFATSSADLLEKAGPNFAFAVDTRPAFFNDADGVAHEAPAQVVYRTDTREALSVVGLEYTPAQVNDFLAPLDPFIRNGTLVPVSVGVFDRGLVRAVELQLPEPMVLPGPNGTEDVLVRRVLWRDSLDGRSRLSLTDLLMRRWCKNGAAEVLGMLGSYFKHTSKKMEEARDLCLSGAIADASSRFALVEANARKLLATSFVRGQMHEVVEELYPAKDNGEGEVSVRAMNARSAIIEMFENGKGNFGRTAWDAVNAVTEYATHGRSVQGRDAAVARLRNIWMGDDFTARGVAAVAKSAGFTVAKDGALLS